MRILIVEDETELRQQLQQMLQQNGYAVDAAADGRDALFMGREYPFDLAVVDIGLPIMSGVEVIQQWRQLGRSFPISPTGPTKTSETRGFAPLLALSADCSAHSLSIWRFASCR